MKKKGFTLIELLAVIVILAIIALIATPVVLNIIEDSRKEAAEASARNIVNAAKTYYMSETMNGRTVGIIDLSGDTLKYDGDQASAGYIEFDKKGNVSGKMYISGYCVEVAESSKLTSRKTTEDICMSLVAMVGDKKYEDIDDAIANWTDGTTLTLLDNVTLSDTIKIKSTENHILDLSSYTMTAASGKNAIEIIVDGQSPAKYCLIINADTNSPGGITATGKACIYYKKSDSTIDRPIIRINGGVFNGSYAINSTSDGATKCPQYEIFGGVFNGNIQLTKNLFRTYGGTFNGFVYCTGDSSAYRLISGGTFKNFTFMTADADYKFSVGTAMRVYDLGVYIDDNNYLVVGGPIITEPSNKFEAFTTNYKWSSYLKYSSAAENGLYYTSAINALKKNNTTTDVVTVYTDKVDLTSFNYQGTINLPENTNKFVIKFVEGTEPLWTITTSSEGKTITYIDSISDGIVTRTYNIQ